MSDRKYKVSTLQNRLEKLKDKYYNETIKPCGNWGDGMRLSKLPSVSSWDKLRTRIEQTETLLKEAIAEGRY